MMTIRRMLGLLLAVVTTVSLHAQGPDYQARQYKSTSGFVLPYRYLAPADSAGRLPLVVFLHGAGERGNDNALQLTHGARLFTDATFRQQHRAYVIFPQCPTESYWSSVQVDRSKMPHDFRFDYANTPATPPLTAVMELVQSMIDAGKVDKHRVYIMGLSMGGMGTFEAVYRYPKVFAAAIPICGAGDEAAYNKSARKTAFRVYHGADDAVVGVNESRDMVKTLQALKVNVAYKEYPGVNHNSWDNVFAEPDVLSWLFAQRR